MISEGFSGGSAVKNLPAMQETQVQSLGQEGPLEKGSATHSSILGLSYLQCWRHHFDSWVGKIPWRRDRLPTPVFLVFPGGSDGKESACNAGHLGSIPGSGRSPGRASVNTLQYSCLENPHGQRSLAGGSS